MAGLEKENSEPLSQPRHAEVEQTELFRPNSVVPPHLSRLRSGTHLDDQSHFHHHHDHDAECSDADTLEGIELEDQPVPQTTLNQDVEAGLRLEKPKSSRSQRDPNLVTWKGKDDTENPKNWSMKRKWAATFIGMSHFVEHNMC